MNTPRLASGDFYFFVGYQCDFRTAQTSAKSKCCPVAEKQFRWADVYLDAIAEISAGCYKATDKAVEEALMAWLEYQIKPRYAGQILPITSQIAEVWGQLFSSRSVTQESGLVFDLFLAATAMVHDLSLVTRNTKHFDSLPIHIINP